VAKDGNFCTVRFTELYQTSGCEICSTGMLACEVDAYHKEYQNSVHMQSYNWLYFSIAWIMQRSVVSFVKEKI